MIHGLIREKSYFEFFSSCYMVWNYFSRRKGCLSRNRKVYADSIFGDIYRLASNRSDGHVPDLHKTDLVNDALRYGTHLRSSVDKSVECGRIAVVYALTRCAQPRHENDLIIPYFASKCRHDYADPISNNTEDANPRDLTGTPTVSSEKFPRPNFSTPIL